VGRRHSQTTTILNICDENGRGFPVDLSQVDGDKVARATVPEHAAGSIQDAAVATFHALARGQVRREAPARSPAYTNVQVTDLGRPARERRRAVPMGRPEPGPVSAPPPPPPSPGFVDQGARVTRPILVAPPPLSSEVRQPAQQVTYEIPNYGPLDTFYHQVIRAGDHLVLVFDKRWHGQQGFPRHTQSSLGMRVHGTDCLFVVKTTGIEFELDGKALCLLAVESEGSYSAYAAQNDPLARAMAAVPFLPEHADGEVWRNPAGPHAPGDDPDFGDGHDAHPGF